ncbi:MAG TPA: hypothetical protein VHZ03_53595 [Trebonia sp.]|nr:hypothetical protein [Trebonia sp.]
MSHGSLAERDSPRDPVDDDLLSQVLGGGVQRRGDSRPVRSSGSRRDEWLYDLGDGARIEEAVLDLAPLKNMYGRRSG